MPVNSTHPQYDAARDTWRRNRDAVAGQEAIKAGGELYLPRPNAADASDENRARYDRYLERALWYASPERTKNSLIGAVFRKGPEKQELVPQIEYLAEDADGAGVSLEQLAKHVVGEQLEVGRIGILVDYPAAEEGLSEEQVRRRNLRATLALYDTESIINWRVAKVGGRLVLTLVVLKELQQTEDDGYAVETEEVYRVLKLEDGHYVQRLFNSKEEQIGEDIEPRNAAGQRWTEIPFVVIGSENNRADVDRAPLTHLCNHAVAYWQTSADHRENLYTHGQLTLGIASDLSVEDWASANPKGVQVGAPVGIFLGSGGSFHTASAPESTSLSKALEDLRAEMAELGAQIITKGGQAQTAEAARIDASAESSVLSNLVGNASEGLEQALEWAAEFMGGDPTAVLFTLNQEFFDEALDPQTRTVMLQELDRGLIAKKDYRASLRKADHIDALRSDEEIDQDVEGQGPALGMMADGAE
ncbi:DUF4055 domain-containing protein [Aureimonas fodinaquatilis]|uniref:DUF4055 domain-containing protein n=1 Tax=Aureimonas fodinaquatilis TaxID=2565783 RepID=A0A5B0DXM4_9HYPH|nr:DUF4055 domain-containing protein [Aureimonas fodinaquatilis]KAA0970300.1 DUF4055 domain-containing protein [Aureimonas fodinaquatilis]